MSSTWEDWGFGAYDAFPRGVLRAMYSDPYADALTVFCCLFDYHLIGDPFTNTKIPFLCNLMLNRSQACMASLTEKSANILWLQSCFS